KTRLTDCLPFPLCEQIDTIRRRSDYPHFSANRRTRPIRPDDERDSFKRYKQLGMTPAATLPPGEQDTTDTPSTAAQAGRGDAFVCGVDNHPFHTVIRLFVRFGFHLHDRVKLKRSRRRGRPSFAVDDDGRTALCQPKLAQIKAGPALAF